MVPHPGQHHKIYYVTKISNNIAITGKGENSLWRTAHELCDFTYPWEDKKPPHTSFRALHSNNWLYCLFEAEDHNINIYVDTNDKSEAAYADRAEIFFRKDEFLSPYYCLEIDPTARIFDFKGEYYRKFDPGWSWPAGQLMVKSHIEKNGYTIEVAISKKSLAGLGLLKGEKLQVGLYRADCIELKGRKAKLRWISWVKPDSDVPDFHIPSSFGAFELTE